MNDSSMLLAPPLPARSPNPYLDIQDPRPLRIIPENISAEAINPANVRRANARRFGKGFGLFFITLAMLAQGLLAFLLFNVFVRDRDFNQKVSEFLIWTAGSLVALFSIIGKVAIVAFYNLSIYEQLFENFRELINDPKTYLNNRTEAPISSQLRTFFDLPWTLNISAVFGIGLTILSGKDIETLLVSNYSHPILTTAGHIIGNIGFMLPLMFASGISNYLGFPNIHSFGLSNIQNFLLYPCKNPDYRKLEKDQQRAIEVISKEWVAVVESQNPLKIEKFLNAFFDYNPSHDHDGLFDINTLKILRPNIGNILKYAKNKMPSVPAETWKEFFVSNGIALSSFAVTVYGLSNFIQMGIYTAELLLPFLPAFVHQSLGVAAFMSMILMSTGVYAPTKDFIKSVFFERGDYHYRVLSKAAELMLRGFYPAMLLGGFPNGYQQYTVSPQPIPITASLVSSANLETPAIIEMITKALENHVINNDPTHVTALGRLIDDKLKQEIGNIPGLGKDDLKARAKVLELNPTEKTRINTINPDYAAWSFTKRAVYAISCCGFLPAPREQGNHQRGSINAASESSPLLTA